MAVISVILAMVSASLVELIQPEILKFSEYGEISESLTGKPGDPVRGAEIMVNRGLGNYIACHVDTDLNKFPWHGEVGPSLDGVTTRWEEPEIRGIIVNAN